MCDIEHRMFLNLPQLIFSWFSLHQDIKVILLDALTCDILKTQSSYFVRTFLFANIASRALISCIINDEKTPHKYLLWLGFGIDITYIYTQVFVLPHIKLKHSLHRWACKM